MLANAQSDTKWLLALIAIFLLGNLTVFALCYFVAKLCLKLQVGYGLIYAVPWVFLAIPIALIVISARTGLLKENHRYFRPVLMLIGTSLITWFAVFHSLFRGLF